MFRRMATLSLFGFCAVILMWIFMFGRVQKKDMDRYNALKQQQETVNTKTAASSAYQNRKGVTKEIYFTQEDNTRLHYRIESESSLLTLQPMGNKFDVIEKLEKIRCWMQDKVYDVSIGTPMQQMRYLQAQEGLYRYTSQQFLAQTVSLSLYRLPGTELPNTLVNATPFMRGVAQDVSFAVSGKTPQFHAQHFKANLSQKEEP